MPNLLKVRLVSPRGIIYQSEALSVSGTNSKGKFDILPQHANFLTVVENGPIIIREKGKKDIKLGLPMAIIYTAKNTVNIYIQF